MPAPTAVRPPTAELAAAFAAIYIVWGSTFLAIRYAVETIPPFAMVATRCLLGGAVLVAIALVRERSGLSWPTWREWGGSVVLGAFLFVGCHGVIAYAEERVPSGTAALCLATIPLFVPLLVWALPGGVPPSRRRTAALLGGFGGVGFHSFFTNYLALSVELRVGPAKGMDFDASIRPPPAIGAGSSSGMPGFVPRAKPRSFAPKPSRWAARWRVSRPIWTCSTRPRFKRPDAARR